VVAATAGTVAALLLANTLLGAATDVWQRQFRQAHAPHVRIDISAPADGDGDAALDALSLQPGVRAVTAAQRTAAVTLLGHGDPHRASAAYAAVRRTGSASELPLTLRADTGGAPRPLLVSGHWLRAGHPGDLVLEQSAAEAAWARPGDLLTVQGGDGHLFQLRVAGVADSPDQIRYPQAGYGLGWVDSATLDRLQPDRSQQGWTIGLYLDDPGTADYAAQRAVTTVGADRVLRLSTWKDARAAWQQGNRLTGLLLGLTGLAALIAAALAVAGAAAGRIRASTADIAVLKTLGFTPARVVRLFTLQHLLLAGTGTLLGVVGAALAVASGVGDGSGLGGSAGLVPGGGAALGGVTAAALIAIGLAAALPAYRAGRVPPVPRPGGVPATGARPPRPARLGLLRRLPPALVLGLRSAWRDRRAGSVTVLRLAAPVMACTLALCTWSTVDVLARSSGGGVTRPALMVHPAVAVTGRDDARLRADLAAGPGVAGVYPGADLESLAPGQSATLTLRALGTSRHPYPLRIVGGRGIEAPDEAVAGQGALDVLHARVGQWVRVTTGGTPRVLHIVGRTVEPENGGRVLSVTMDTLNRPGDPVVPAYYGVVLRPGADPAAVRRDLSLTSGLGVDLDVESAPHQIGRLTALRGAVVGLAVLLALIAVAELLTTAARGMRAHRHDLVLLRTIGLTPRQAFGMMATRGAVPALVGVVLGVALGVPLALRLIDAQGRADGVGAGIAHAPSVAALLALVVLTATAGAALSALAALRAARSQPRPAYG
jgi:putative ABC transport system permease protein